MDIVFLSSRICLPLTSQFFKHTSASFFPSQKWKSKNNKKSSKTLWKNLQLSFFSRYILFLFKKSRGVSFHRMQNIVGGSSYCIREKSAYDLAEGSWSSTAAAFYRFPMHLSIFHWSRRILRDSFLYPHVKTLCIRNKPSEHPRLPFHLLPMQERKSLV